MKMDAREQNTLTVGEKVLRTPGTFYDVVFNKDGRMKSEHHPMTGTVTYVHPGNRFHVVEFETSGGAIRESFRGA